MKHDCLLNKLERILWVAGILIVLIVPIIFASADRRDWQVLALPPGVVVSLHGLLFWIIRRCQRRTRQ